MSITARGKLGVVCMDWYVVHSSLKPIFLTRCRFCLLWDTSPLLPLTGVTVNTCTSAETNWNGEKFRCETWVTRLLEAIDSRCYHFFCLSPSSPVSHTQLQHSRKHREQMVYMRKKTSERNGEWAKRQKRELKSWISRQTVEMKRICLPTEDKPSVTAARGSHLCQCLDDLLQRCNTLENRRTEMKFTILRRASEIFF